MKSCYSHTLPAKRQTGSSALALTCIHFIFLMCIAVALYSCKSSDDISVNQLYGRWEIGKAEKNGKLTPYLRGGYLIIKEEGSIVVNITGTDETDRYTLTDRILKLNENQEFVIQSLTADSLTIQYRMNPQTQFVFYMHRHENKTQ